jgi:maltoporin
MTTCRKRKRGLQAYNSSWAHSNFTDISAQDGQQVAFQAPGTKAKYRFANEAETYGEFIFVNNWLNPEVQPDQTWVKTEIMIEANTTNSTNYADFPLPVVNGEAMSVGNTSTLIP